MVGHFEMRQNRVAEGEFHVALIRNHLRVVDRFGQIGEQRAHLGFGFDVELVGGKLEPGLFAEHVVGADADQHLLHFGVLFAKIVRVVGGDRRDAGLFGKPHEIGNQRKLFAQAVVLHFQIEIAFAEEVAVPQGGLFGAVVIAGEQRARDLARQARRQRDQPLVVFRQQLFVDPRLGIEALRPRLADHGDQVAVALFVFAKQHQVMPLCVEPARFVEPAARGHVAFAADDRLDAGLFGSLIKLDRAEHGPVVGHCHGRHTLFLHVVHQTRDAAGAVQQAVFGMQMQMGEWHSGASFLFCVYSAQDTIPPAADCTSLCPASRSWCNTRDRSPCRAWRPRAF